MCWTLRAVLAAAALPTVAGAPPALRGTAEGAGRGLAECARLVAWVEQQCRHRTCTKLSGGRSCSEFCVEAQRGCGGAWLAPVGDCALPRVTSCAAPSAGAVHFCACQVWEHRTNNEGLNNATWGNRTQHDGRNNATDGNGTSAPVARAGTTTKLATATPAPETTSRAGASSSRRAPERAISGAGRAPGTPAPTTTGLAVATPETTSTAERCMLDLHVERQCSADGCMVLAEGMRYRSCGEYCSLHGLGCVGGWEEHDDSCVADYAVGCDARLRTDDLLCRCSPSAAPSEPTTPAGNRCDLWRDVERICSADGCKVLVEEMKQKNCRDYCGEHGLECVGAWEESDDDCTAENNVTCDARLDTDDLLCECAPAGRLLVAGLAAKAPALVTTSAAAPPAGVKATLPPAAANNVSTDARSCQLQGVARLCSADGCRALVKDMMYRNCAEFCGEHALKCLGAWHDHNDTCAVQSTLACEARVRRDDLICECLAPGAR